MSGKAGMIAVIGLLAVVGLCGTGWAAEAAEATSSTESSTPAEKPDTLKPGEPSAVATIHCIGVMWPVEGDADGGATCAVSFREAGGDKWLEALPLYRKAPAEAAQTGRRGGRNSAYASPHLAANYLAGSIFNLKPGTTYEVKLKLADVDSGYSQEKALKVRTRTEPVLPATAATAEVTVEGGAEALAAAFEGAKPGDVILVHAGTYQGPFRIGASGTAEKPIVIRGAGDGPAVIKGQGYEDNYEGVSKHICMQIDGSYIFVDSLEFDDAVTAINIGPGRFTGREQWDELQAGGGMLSDIVITHCKTRRTQYGITGTANQCHVADNDFTGLAADVEGIDWSEGEGVEIHGSGTVICYNRMYHMADAVSIYYFTSNQDVYNNDTYSNSDDGIELDYSEANNRVWDNRFWFPANNGVSFQPYIGGPAYVIRNEVIGAKENCSKDRFGARDVLFFNNTFIGHKADPAIGRNCLLASFDMPLHCVSRNNLYIIQEGTDLPSVDVHAEDAANHTVDMDYDGLGGVIMISSRNGGKEVDPAMYAGSRYVDGDGLYIPIDSFRKVARTLEHYTLVDPAKIFDKPLPPMQDWLQQKGPGELMTLKEGCVAIDAGTVLPTVTDGYAGKAPDLGAHEFGKPAPHYGPRQRSSE